MPTWELDSVVDYYDANTDVVAVSGARLEALSEADRSAALATVSARVRELVNAMGLDRDQFVGLIVSVVDDFYKTVAGATAWDRSGSQYCSAVFATLLDLATERGLQVRYVVENTFPDFLDRPLQFYPQVFGEIGMAYVCPQIYAWKLAQADGRIAPGEDPQIERFVQVMDESRMLARRVLRELLERRQHLAYFEIDWTEGSLDAVLKIDESPGTVLMFRNAPPVAGSTIEVRVS